MQSKAGRSNGYFSKYGARSAAAFFAPNSWIGVSLIAEGAENAGKTRGTDLFLVHDRTEAISFAVKRAKKGDTVILLGKGHEKTIERANGENPWDEIATTRDALKQLS